MKKTNAILVGTTALFVVTSVYLLYSEAPKHDTPTSQTLTLDVDNNTSPPQSSQTQPLTKQSEKSDIKFSEENESTQNQTESLITQLFPEGDRAWGWAKVDLDQIKQDLPNNLYWTYGAPTKDENLLALRKESKALRDKQFGKIQSNTATEEEIRDYYNHQFQISNDYIEFATALLNKHAQDLSERDYGMQSLARKLHLSRLEEIPRKLSRALERQEEQSQKRQNWIADKEQYEANLVQEREDALRALGKI